MAWREAPPSFTHYTGHMCSTIAERGIDSLQKVCLGVVSKTDSSKVLVTARTDRLFRARLEHLSR